MSRIPRFRAKRIDNGNWVYGDYFKTPLTDENSGTNPEAGWFFLTGEPRHCIGQNGVAYVVDEKTLGESTGLLDKNSKEIWEGDICGIELTPFLGQNADGLDQWGKPFIQKAPVIFERGFFSLDAPDYHSSLSDKSIEVLGNIWDHPSLLNQEEV